MLESMGIDCPVIGVLGAAMNKVLGLSTFYTSPEKEVWAWTATKNSTALEASASIHIDIQRGFI
jgi:ribosome-binding ATPase YchF (GTP1/OBG family)